jgi:segregation and condensation protein A
MECNINIEVFSGPLDLLLHLIKKNEIDIHDIPMALITEQYLEYLKLMRSLNLDIASEYLVMAATLVHIKSQMILPTTQPVDVSEEEGEGEDPRAELVRRLLEYQRYKEAAEVLARSQMLDRDVFLRSPPREYDEEGETPLREATLFDLLDAFKRLMAARGLEEMGLQMERERLSLMDRIEQIMDRLRGRPQGMSFEELFQEGDQGRSMLILTFLAILEMVRMRMIKAYQSIPHGTIMITTA